MAFRDGILVFRQPGALPAAAFEEIIQNVMKLDMQSIKAEIAKEKSQSSAD